MMDKEAQEKIKAILRHYFREQLGLAAAIDIADEILEAIGYRKIKDKPPLLADNPYIYESEECRQHTAFDKGKRAQREADIKFYEGIIKKGVGNGL